MFVESLFKIVPSWKLKWPSTSERINKFQYVPIMDTHSAIKINQLLIHTTQWMKTQSILLVKWSERSQIRKTTCCLMTFIWHSKKCQRIRTDNGSLVARVGGWGMPINGTQGNFLRCWNCSVLYLFVVVCGDGYTCLPLSNLSIWHFKILLCVNYTSINMGQG